MGIDVYGLVFDDDNEAKFAAHRVIPQEVVEVFEGRPGFHRNDGPRKRASHVMVGPTIAGRILLIPIERVEPGMWRPTTAFEPSTHQSARFRRSAR